MIVSCRGRRTFHEAERKWANFYRGDAARAVYSAFLFALSVKVDSVGLVHESLCAVFLLHRSTEPNKSLAAFMLDELQLKSCLFFIINHSRLLTDRQHLHRELPALCLTEIKQLERTVLSFFFYLNLSKTFEFKVMNSKSLQTILEDAKIALAIFTWNFSTNTKEIVYCSLSVAMGTIYERAFLTQLFSHVLF